MIANNRYKQFSIDQQLIIRGITIHNTHNAYSARENLQWMEHSALNFAAHVFIDENEVVEALPLARGCFHTGKAFDRGNQETIAVEICRCTSSLSLYLEAQKRAIHWIKKTLTANNLDQRAIFFHQDFDERAYCPHRIFEIYGNKQNFIEKELNSCP